MDEQRKIRIIVALNHLKDIINPALDNDFYQLWLKTDRKIKFRSWVIDKIKELILIELDASEPILDGKDAEELINEVNNPIYSVEKDKFLKSCVKTYKSTIEKKKS